MNKLTKSSFVVSLPASILLLVQLFAPFGARAQSVSASGSVGVVASSNPVVFDGNHANDDLVQFSKLRIESISTPTLPSIITAYTDFGLDCVKFNEKNQRTICPKVVSRQYQIRVTTETILLLKNRARASFSDFEVGDLINVYGFKDPNMDGIDALVMRNLDRPRAQRYVQFNSAEVVVPSSSNTLPAQIGVVRNPSFPCYDFGSGNELRQDFACPLGIESSSKKETLTNGSATAKSLLTQSVANDMVLARKYLVNITSETVLTKRDRTVATLADITLGDQLNIYGLLKDDGTVDAKIIRDLSKPANGVGASLSIKTNSSLSGIQGTYFMAEFKVSGGVMPYTIKMDGGNDMLGLILSRIKPCPPNMGCTAVVGQESPDTIYLYGTPYKGGNFSFAIVVRDSGTPVGSGQAKFGVTIQSLQAKEPPRDTTTTDIFSSGMNAYLHIGPTCPGPVQMYSYSTDMNCSDKPYADISVLATNSAGVQYKGQTDKNGNVHIAVPAGMYTITIPSAKMYPHCEEKSVAVTTNAFVNVDISCDSGIR